MNKSIVNQLGIDIEKLLETSNEANRKTEQIPVEAHLSAGVTNTNKTAILQINIADDINTSVKLNSTLELLSRKFKAVTILLDMGLALLVYRIILPYMPEEQLQNIIIRRKLEWLNTNMPVIKKAKVSCSIITDKEQSLQTPKEEITLKLDKFMQRDHAFRKKIAADVELLKAELSATHNISTAMYQHERYKNDKFIELYLTSKIATIAALSSAGSYSQHSYIALTKMQSYNYLQKTAPMRNLPTYLTLSFRASARDNNQKILTSTELNQNSHEIDLLGKISAQQSYLEHSVQHFSGNAYLESLNGTFISCNDQQAISFGLKDKSYIEGQSFAKLLPKYQSDMIERIVTDVTTKNETSLLLETIIYLGKPCKLLSIKMPLKNKKNKPIGVLGFSIQIEDKAEARKLKNLEYNATTPIDLMQTIVPSSISPSNDKYDAGYIKSMIEHMPGHVFWQDTDGKILGCNQNQAEFMGLNSPEQLIGKDASDFLTQEDAKAAIASLKKIVATGEPMIQKETYKSGNNLLVMVSHKTAIKDDKGKVISIMVVALEAEQAGQRAKDIGFKDNFIKAVKNDLQNPFDSLLKMAKECESDETGLKKKHQLLEISNYAKNLVNKNITAEIDEN